MPLRATTPLCDPCSRGNHEPCRYRPGDCPCDCRNPSFLNHYSLTNPVTAWLIGRAPEIVAAKPGSLYAHDRPPTCPQEDADGRVCGAKMLLRPGWWKCFRHGDEPVALMVRPEYEPTLAGDVLGLLRRL